MAVMAGCDPAGTGSSFIPQQDLSLRSLPAASLEFCFLLRRMEAMSPPPLLPPLEIKNLS